MNEKKNEQVERLRRYAKMIEKQTGRAVRPYRADGYVNVLNRYGTSKDTLENYQFKAEPTVPDETLSEFYEGNGLFATIIDTPAEEAIRHGFSLIDVKDDNVKSFYEEALEELDWEETAMKAIRWARLFGGSIAVMLINDGRGIDEPLDWKNIQSIDDIRVYDRSVIQPDYHGMFSYSPTDPFRTRGSRLGMPEYYDVFSKYGKFRVHESRCLVFQNGSLPENCTNTIYEMWGMPEYIRLKRAIRDTEIAHGNAPKLLEKSVQAVYKMQGLSSLLSTAEGEDLVLKRLQVIDMARGLLNSIAIDSEGEDYNFQTFQFSGIADVVSASCNYLSALSHIPQTILFGQHIGGMSSTDDTSMENWYNFVGRIQKRMLKPNLRYLLSVIFQAGVATGEVEEVPKIRVEFAPLWSETEMEKATLEQTRANTQQIKANTAQIYVSMQAIDPSEVRKKLAETEEFDVENMLDDLEDEDLFAHMELGEEETPDHDMMGNQPDLNSNGNSPDAAPAATKLPQDMTDGEKLQKAAKGLPNGENTDSEEPPENGEPKSVGVIVVSDGKVLCGTRHNDFGYGLICGPGGHIEDGETAEEAAIRETEEEFGITPKDLTMIGYGPAEPDTGLTPAIFLCTEWDGDIECKDLEIAAPLFRTLEELEQLEASMFQPFKDGIEVMLSTINDETATDGGPGSGNFGHEGRPGELGGSLPNATNTNERLRAAIKEGEAAFNMVAKKAVETAEVGTQFEQFGATFEKVDDNKWLDSSSGETLTDDGVEHLCFSYWGGEDSVPVFKELTSEKVAEAKIASGDIDIEDAPDVNVASAIADYQNYGYGPLNTALRNGEQPEGRAAVIDAGLQQGFDNQEPTVTPMTLLRDSGTAVTTEAFEATGLDKFLGQKLHSNSLREAWYDAEIRDEIRGKLIGYEFTEKGYTSTTSSSEFLREFSEGNGSQDMIMTTGAKETMCIKVPKGTKVLDLGKDGYISGSGESEVILNKGAKYTITDVSFDSGTQSLMLFCNYSNKNADANDMSINSFIPENSIDKSVNSATIKSQKIPTSNADFGVKGMKWGERKEENPSGSNGVKKTKVTHFKTQNGVMTVTSDTKAKLGTNGGATIKKGEITNVEVFAGKGGKKPMELADKFANTYGGKASDWMHSTGNGKIKLSDGTEKNAEIHWFECEGVGQTKWKIKKFKKG